MKVAFNTNSYLEKYDQHTGELLQMREKLHRGASWK